MKKKLVLLLKGLGIGAANVIPGISGGTIALISGVYLPALEALGTIFTSGSQKKQSMVFLLPLVAGIMGGILGFSLLMDFLLSAYASWISASITGLVIGSIPLIWKQARKHPLRLLTIVFMAGGFLLSALLPFLTPAEKAITTEFPSLILFFSAIPAITAMLIPGISGSLVLVILGVYPLVLSSIANLHWLSLLAFFLGALLGIATFSRIIRIINQRHPSYVLWTVFGLVLGSPLATLKLTEITQQPFAHLIVLILSAALSSLLFFSHKSS